MVFPLLSPKEMLEVGLCCFAHFHSCFLQTLSDCLLQIAPCIFQFVFLLKVPVSLWFFLPICCGIHIKPWSILRSGKPSDLHFASQLRHVLLREESFSLFLYNLYTNWPHRSDYIASLFTKPTRLQVLTSIMSYNNASLFVFFFFHWASRSPY